MRNRQRKLFSRLVINNSNDKNILCNTQYKIIEKIKRSNEKYISLDEYINICLYSQNAFYYNNENIAKIGEQYS